MKTPLTGHILTNRLVLQIESLQDGFRRLSRPMTLNDLAARFVRIAGNAFPGDTIDLFFNSGHAGSWQKLSGESPGTIQSLLRVPEGDATSVFSRHRQATCVSMVQKLVDKSFVGIIIGQKRARKKFTDGDRVSLQLCLHLFDNAYQSLLYRRNEKELIFSLNHRVLQLNSLVDTGIEVSKIGQEHSLQHLALERAASLTNASSGLVRVSRGRSVKEQFVFPAGGRHSGRRNAGYRITSSFRFGRNSYRFELFEKESRNGLIAFEETDQLLLDALVRQVHASLENRYLLQQTLEKQKIEQEITVAASIQQKILPTALPVFEGYDIAGINIPSKSVGGDYYDCLSLPDGRYALIIADVAGKGVPAALLVSSFHAYLSAYLESPLPLVELVKRLNRAVCRAATQDRFITAFLALLTPETGELESVNAGHTSGYVLRGNGILQELSKGGVPFGMMDMDFPYESERMRLEKGERLLLYTDGVTEASNVRDELFDSTVPLAGFLAAHKPDRAQVFIADLISEIKKFTGDAPQNDDITAIYLLRT